MSEDSHKTTAITFLQLAATGRIDEAFEKYISANLIHHNAFFPGDRESLQNAIGKSAMDNPQTTIDTKLAIVEGNLVTTLSHVKHKPQDTGYAVAHFFRFDGDKVVEMWDIAMQIPDNSPNKNGVF